MNTLVIYDQTGYIIDQKNGSVREPIGIPFLWVDIPNNMRIKITDGIGVNVNVTPNKVYLEEIPKTEEEKLKERVDATESAIIALMDMQLL